jgi:hypothetical protein
MNMNNDPEIGPKIKEQAQIVFDEVVKTGNYRDVTIAQAKGKMLANPFGFLQNPENVFLRTDEGLYAKEESIPINAQNTAATTGARITAGATTAGKPANTTLSNLDEKMAQYNSLSDAKELFKDKFSTQYAGKQFKYNWLRQNDPEFGQFITSLQLFANNYRKENFGTAQSAAEIQNFLDVINSDLSVKPQVLQAQINTIQKNMERDYAAYINGRKGTNAFDDMYYNEMYTRGNEVLKGSNSNKPAPTKPAAGETKVIGGKTYKKVAGGWQAQ